MPMVAGRFQRLSDIGSVKPATNYQRLTCALSNPSGAPPGQNRTATGLGGPAAGNTKRLASNFKRDRTAAPPLSARAFAILDAGTVVAIVAGLDAARAFLLRAMSP
jgi:hypothetical protein